MWHIASGWASISLPVGIVHPRSLTLPSPILVPFWSLPPVWLVRLASVFAAIKRDEVVSGLPCSGWGGRGILCLFPGLDLGWEPLGPVDLIPLPHWGLLPCRSWAWLCCGPAGFFLQLCAPGMHAGIPKEESVQREKTSFSPFQLTGGDTHT